MLSPQRAQKYSLDFFDETWGPYEQLAAWVIIETEIEIQELQKRIKNPCKYKKIIHNQEEKLEEIFDWIHIDSKEEGSLHFWAMRFTENPSAIIRLLRKKYPRGKA